MPIGVNLSTTHSPARVETPASKRKSSQEDSEEEFLNSSVLFQRTLAIRQGIHSLADWRTGERTGGLTA